MSAVSTQLVRKLCGRVGTRRKVATLAGKVDALARHVGVVQLADGVYAGKSADLGWGRVYGGQTMAQAVAAAQATAGPNREMHHFSSHFLKGGDPSTDIRFETSLLSSGRSFSVIHVRALQNDVSILCMTASFQTPEVGLEHQHPAGLRPEWGRPTDLKPLEAHMQAHIDKVPRKMVKLYSEGPLEIRPSKFVAPWDTSLHEPERAFWVRTRGAVADDAALHQRLLTCAHATQLQSTLVIHPLHRRLTRRPPPSPHRPTSCLAACVPADVSDWGLLETSIMPLPVAMWLPQMQAGSLSHSMHFHHPSRFRLDTEWLCHVMRSPVASGGRGFALGEVWTESGLLVATTSQEGLVRMRSASPSAQSERSDVERAP